MSGEHFCFTSPDDPERLECEQCAVFAERADYWRDASEKRDAWLDAEMYRRRAALDAEMDRRRAAEAEVERLREAANFAANAADGFRAELEQLRYDHETEIERLTSERDAFMEMAERLTADLEALRARVFVRR